MGSCNTGRIGILVLVMLFAFLETGAQFAMLDASATRTLDESSAASLTIDMRTAQATSSSGTTERCAGREEYESECSWWSGEPHHRYLMFGRLGFGEGIGANLLRIAWAFNRAMMFDLELVFVGPIAAEHEVGEFGEWFGLTSNPLLELQDTKAYHRAERQEVPFSQGNEHDWFNSERNRSSVVYVPNTGEVQKIKDWGRPINPPPEDTRVCRYVRQSLRQLFWSVPDRRDRCRSILRDSTGYLEFLKQSAVGQRPTGNKYNETDDQQTENNVELEVTQRPWIVAVHIRRGDMIHFKNGARIIPHAYFVATVRSVLQGIARVPESQKTAHTITAQVCVLVFSEGTPDMQGFQLPDEHGHVVEWNIPRHTCRKLGLHCYQEIFLQTSAKATFDCLAAADIVIGSESSFSEGAAAVSTNVKVMLWEGEIEQDRVTLDAAKVVSAGSVDAEKQGEMDSAIRNWWQCSQEARGSSMFLQRDANRNRSATGAVGAGRCFYETVDP